MTETTTDRTADEAKGTGMPGWFKWGLVAVAVAAALLVGAHLLGARPGH